uniref:NADH dehydrogenase subunit 5 n=1 Tax=Tassonia gloriae TaxID=3064207 RepID=UPI00286B0930|nr:NADH dehydrogenase subunit 5 [Tassonia gloriae]WKV28892.1 NADH dehydrogenase subunit 5 [Tassonia gloriae]
MFLFYLIGSVLLILSVIFLCFSFILLYLNFSIFLEWNLMNLNSVKLVMLIYLDWISLLFMFTVLLISSMILFYCCEYMSHDLNNIRFFYLLILFVLSMVLMVLSPNLLSLILGWDGLGLTSYGLVIFYQNYSSYNSGMLTVLMNRVGDILIILSISLMMIYGDMSIILSNYKMFLLSLLIMLASFTKSAQFPFSSWLPAAMAAPTPVSSLVHSSTLVTAGIYLLIRFNNLIYSDKFILYLMMSIGMITMFMAGISANFEYDFKKIIAYSTLSQLGLMVVIYSMKFYILSFNHLVIHAMFKSMMFMCSGVVIHSMLNYQDIRYMGQLLEFLPFTVSMFMISNFSLCGLPFFSGFYSKDLILEKIFLSDFSLIMYFLLIFSTMLTVMYSGRLAYYLISKNYNFLSFYKISDLALMNFPMLILVFNSIFLGAGMMSLVFLSIEDVYLMTMEKFQVLFICLISVFLFIYKFQEKFKKNFMIKYIFGKMFLLNYMNKQNVQLLMKMKFYNELLDKGVFKLYMEGMVIEILNWMNFKYVNKNNNLLEFLFFLSFLVLIVTLV